MVTEGSQKDVELREVDADAKPRIHFLYVQLHPEMLTLHGCLAHKKQPPSLGPP